MLEVNPRASPHGAVRQQGHRRAAGQAGAPGHGRAHARRTSASPSEIVPPHYSVKEAVFPFIRFPGVDIVLGPEMKSTGEVMGIDEDLGMAYAKAQMPAPSRRCRLAATCSSRSRKPTRTASRRSPPSSRRSGSKSSPRTARRALLLRREWRSPTLQTQRRPAPRARHDQERPARFHREYPQRENATRGRGENPQCCGRARASRS